MLYSHGKERNHPSESHTFTAKPLSSGVIVSYHWMFECMKGQGLRS